MAEEEKPEGEEPEETRGEDAAEGEEGEGSAEGSPKSGKFSKRKLLLAGGAFLLLLTIPAVLFFTGIIGPKDEEPTEEAPAATPEETTAEAKEPIFYEMEEFLINLNTGGKQVKFLKMNVLLELSDQADVPQVEGRLPRIRDSFQIYLRELRLEDLQGSKGIHRLREELLLRVNRELYPVKVNNILFKDILVQ